MMKDVFMVIVKKSALITLVILLISFFSPILFAKTLAMSEPTIYTKNFRDTWQFDVIPYIWFLNMNGRVGVADKTAHIDQDFSDIWQKLNIAGMVFLEANKGNAGIFLNALYSKLSDRVSQGPFSVDATTRYELYSAGASYTVYRNCFKDACGGIGSMLEITPYAGLRYTVNDTTVDVSAPFLDIGRSDNQSWVDPIIGARLKYAFAKAWLITLAGDLGGTNHSTDYSYNVMGVLGYSPQTFWTNTTTYIGYRLLYQHYTTGSGSGLYNWDMKLFGPMLGFGISF
jgi:hypothetical protein